MATLTDTEARAVFDTALAAPASRWKMTNLGHILDLSHDGYDYQIQMPASGKYLAQITYRSGWGGTEHLHGANTNATQADHRALLTTARSAR